MNMREGSARRKEKEADWKKKGKEDGSVTTLNDGVGKVAGLGFPFVYHYARKPYQ